MFRNVIRLQRVHYNILTQEFSMILEEMYYAS